MIVQELLDKLEGLDPDTPIVYEFGTYEGSVTDAEVYAGSETDGRPVFILFCSEEIQ